MRAHYLFELLCGLSALALMALGTLLFLLAVFAPPGWLQRDSAHLTALALLFVGALLSAFGAWPVGGVLLFVGAVLIGLTYSARKHNAANTGR